MPIFEYDTDLIDDLTTRFDLRTPNARGLDAAVTALAAQTEPRQVVLDMATGIGKTYLLAALLEYAATHGVRNLLVVLPGKTVRTKTINNFTPGADGFITGAEIPKTVITPQNFADSATPLRDPSSVKLFLLNVHHLVQQDTTEFIAAGSAKSRNLRTARPQETLGGSLLEYLTNADDLLMVLDESHLYSESAKTWQPALDRLRPAGRVGLTATPVKGDKVIFQYRLRDAIQEQYVKQPVVALRRNGYPDNEELGKLRDAKSLLDKKASEYQNYELAHPEVQRINPILLVSCRDINHAEEVSAVLRGSQFFGSDDAVLTIHSDAMTNEVEQSLARVQAPDSPVRAVVQVDMLSEGWNVHNVAVMLPLRALESGTLTEQLIGRGLRLPYGKYTGVEWIDTLDVVSHTSVKDALKAHGLGDNREIEDLPTPPPINPTVGGGDSTSTSPSSPDAQPFEGTGHDAGTTPPTGGGTTLPGFDRAIPFSDADTPDSGQPSGTSGDTVVDTVADLGGATRDLGDDGPPIPTPPPAPVRIERVFNVDFYFPSSTIERTVERLRFTDLSSDWIKTVAASLGSDSDVAIERHAIVIVDGNKVKLEAGTQGDSYDLPMSADDVAEHLMRALWQTPSAKNGAEGLANRKGSRSLARRIVDAASGDWTPKRAETAAHKLKNAVRDEATRVARSGRPIPKVKAIKLPVRHYFEIPAHPEIISQHRASKANFSTSRYYNEWKRAMFEAANFDAYDTELRIAKLLDVSPDIVWWTRLLISDGASIEYGVGRAYYPDFVAYDTDGVHWIIEGKSDSGKQDEIVQDKRKATERVLREMETLDEWQDARWGYLIAYQDDVTRAESWRDLLAWSEPEKMA